MARYLVGIDLGTTNSAVAFVDLQSQPRGGGVKLQTFPIAQLVGPGEMGERPLLPSYLYLPGPHDLPPGAAALPWKPDAHEVVGEFAREQGSRVPGRLVSSAKSWLCHAGVDRIAPLLPWGAPPDVPRLSPLEVSAHYLRHIVQAWNHAPGRKEAEFLESQTVVLTVPASFDDVARELTMEAAKQAGLKNVTLLEEPQAAFYCWMGMSKPAEIGRMKPGMRCVVVDVGGGTTDLSLIRAEEVQGELSFVRDAVGDHLLLGGDNMDLALARFVETKLGGAKIDAAQFGQLVQACRQAKEALLGPEPPAEYRITVVGRGRAVIGGTLHTTVTPEDARRIIFEGFFPRVGLNEEPQQRARAGLQEMGLPYVGDPAITRHLASFLRQQLPPGAAPDTILFNGGVFQPQTLRDHLVGVMRSWYDTPDRPWKPLVLSTPSLDLAVSWGAAYAAWLRHVGGKRIGGGIPRSYYIGVEADVPVPPDKIAVLCVVPRRLEEGQTVSLPEPELELALGEPVVFPLFTSTVRGDDHAGEVLAVSPAQLLQLPPLHTILRGGKRAGVKRTPVTLEARSTEIGTLELYCIARDGTNRWKLEFNIRDIVKEPAARPAEGAEQQGLVDVWPEAQVQAAAGLIRGTYAGDPGAPPPKELTRALEGALDARRDDWPSGLCRRLWEFVAEVAEQRGRSVPHLNRWYHLAGFCLRPGFGDPLDRHRVEQLWKMIAAPPKGTGGAALVEGGADYWIMWRRVAGGLNVQLQQNLFNRLRPVLLPGKGKPPAKPNPNELAEMWRAAASLERLDVRSKEALGEALVKQVRRPPAPNYAFWALTRLGARVLFYGPLNAVLHPHIAERWIDAIAGFEPTHESERSQWAFCMAQLARLTGQRALDVDDSHRKTVRSALKGAGAPEMWLRMVEEVLELESRDQSQMFGESLPIGLRLAGG
ncbi:MAG TPA: Hsp70 family protein [Gemmataceae bacterium]